METIKRGELKELVEPRRGPCVSAFMPTHIAGAETLQDPIRLKNLIRQAQLSLEQQGWTGDVVDDVLRPMRQLIGLYSFWQHQTEGLALFSAPGFFRRYSVPFEVPELAVVANRFQVKPLLPVVDADGPHYLLALGQNGARLYQSNRDGLDPADDITLPASPLAPVHADRGQGRALQTHGAGSGRHFLLFHGNSTRDEQRKQLLLSYFRAVDDVLRSHLEDETPVVLAGVTYLCALYRHASRLSGLAPGEIHGNPDHFSREELHRRSWEIASSSYRSLQEKTADEYYQLWHTVRASNNVRDIAAAARDGRVKTLFVALGAQERARTAPRPEPDPEQAGTEPSGDRDLLNTAALDTFLKGGRVFAVPPDLVPGHGSVAAVFRY